MPVHHPSLTLQMDLDDALCTEEVVAAIKRSYAYVAPSSVVSHARNGALPENTLRLRTRLNKPYWERDTEGAEEVWAESLLPWLANMAYKVSATMGAFNNVALKEGTDVIVYDWLEVDFRDHVRVAVHLGQDCAAVAETVGLVNAAREACNAGAFSTEGLACIRIPSRASYGEQRARAAAAQAAGQGGGDEACQRAAGVAAASGGELQEGAVPDATGDATPGPVAGEAPGFEEEERTWEPDLTFDIDYARWGLEYEDGTVSEYPTPVAS